MLILLIAEIKKIRVEVSSNGIKFKPNFVKIGSLVEKLKGKIHFSYDSSPTPPPRPRPATTTS
jgi:hypothetical protein